MRSSARLVVTFAVAILAGTLIAFSGCSSAGDVTVPAGTVLDVTVTPAAPSAYQTFRVIAHAHNDQAKLHPWASCTIDGDESYWTPTAGQIAGHDVYYEFPLDAAEGAHDVTVEVETISSVKTSKTITVAVSPKATQEPLVQTR